MSILKKPIIQKPIDAEYEAQQIIDDTVRLVETMLFLWEGGVRKLWESKDPQAVLNVLGPYSGEVFGLSSDFIQLMQKHLPQKNPELYQRMVDVLEIIKPHTVNEDGTVTII